MDEAKRRRQAPYFLSLKWKALFLFSLVLIGVNATLSALSYFDQIDQFEQQRGAAYQRYQNQIQGLLALTAQRLRQAGAILPELAGMRDALLRGKPEPLQRAFEDHWQTLRLELGIESAHLYDSNNALIYRWTEHPGLADELAPHEHRWVQQVSEQEHPLTALHCTDDCVQYAVVPVLADEGEYRTIVLSSSMADVVLGFQQLTGADTGMILGSATAGNNASAPEKALPAWDVRIGALTNTRANLELLRHISTRADLDTVIDSGFRAHYNGRDFEVRITPVQEFGSDAPHSWVLIEDVSADLTQIETATRHSILAGAAGLILSEALLLAILWNPMARLGRTSRALPLLAQRAFEQVRETIGAHATGRRLSDEIDVLDNASVSLSHQLEHLEREVQEHTHSLALRMRDLAKERDFVRRLLDNTEAMIVTQDTSGKLLMLNQFSETLSGYEKSELMGRRFVELLGPTGLPDNLEQRLATLGQNGEKRLRHESELISKNQRRRYIAWVHSNLPRETPEESATLSVGIDFTERKQAERRLSWLADHDPLTSLFNRRRFQRELQNLVAEADHTGQAGALLFFDLDQFKYVNDTSGHHAGDSLLQRVAQELVQVTQQDDLVARLGGDEFALAVRNSDPESCLRVAAAINERLGSIRFPAGGRIHRVSASIGIAMFPTHGASVPTLLANADIAMYQAKNIGRGGCHLFSLDDRARERLHEEVYWKGKIEASLLGDRFELYFQPIMHIVDGSVSHYEALLRMRDDDGTLVTPGVLIAVAEHTGLIRAVDRMVLTKAVQQLGRLVRQGYDINFSVNLSGHAFADPELLCLLERLLSDTALDPRRLIFELTETAAVADLTAARSLMQAIKSLGCQFALDDFGVGFSSFHYLKQLPVDFVKIDGSFIRNLDQNREDRLFVRALADVVEGLGKKSIAEFVEHPRIVERLREFGVDYAQGFHIGRPAQEPLTMGAAEPQQRKLQRPHG